MRVRRLNICEEPMDAIGGPAHPFPSARPLRVGLTGAVVSDTGPAKICYDVTPADGEPGGLLGFVGGDEARRWGPTTGR
jgi:hypothetical protein